MAVNNNIQVTVTKKGSMSLDSEVHPLNAHDIAVVRSITPGTPSDGSVIVLAQPESGRPYNESTWTVSETVAEIHTLIDSYHAEVAAVKVDCTKVDTITVDEEILLNLEYCKIAPYGSGSKIYSSPHGKHSQTVYIVDEAPEDLTVEAGGSST